MARGNARQAIFLDDRDRRRFVGLLSRVAKRMNVRCHAYCLMANHYHLLLETPDANLSLAIRQLNGIYAQSFNRRHDRVGHLFQGRFVSKLIDHAAYLLTVSRYIVMNPVRGGLVRHPALWVWSSYRATAGLIATPGFLVVDDVLADLGSMHRQEARRAYRRFVLDTSEIDELGDGPILGDSEFCARHESQLTERSLDPDIPRRQRFAGRPSLESIFAGRVDRAARDARIRTAYLDHGYTMATIARHLGVHRMTVSRIVK